MIMPVRRTIQPHPSTRSSFSKGAISGLFPVEMGLFFDDGSERRAGLRRVLCVGSNRKIAVSTLNVAFFVVRGVYGCVEQSARRGVARNA